MSTELFLYGRWHTKDSTVETPFQYHPFFRISRSNTSAVLFRILISNLYTGSKSHNAYNTRFSFTQTSHCNSNNLLVLSLIHRNTIISLLISNLYTGSKSHNAYNTRFLGLLKNSANSFHSFICSCHLPASFQSISAQNYWQTFYHQAHALWNSLPQQLRVLSSASPSNQQLSPLTVFFSILDYLLSGLTLWNSTRPDLHVIHTPFHFSFISTSFIALLFFIHDVVRVPEKYDRNNSFLSALWCTLNLPHSPIHYSSHLISSHVLLITHKPLFLIEEYIKLIILNNMILNINQDLLFTMWRWSFDRLTLIAWR